MIQEGNNDDSSLIPCYVKEIITTDARHEQGIKVCCENNKEGRVRSIGTEASTMSSMELLVDLEKKLRRVIVDELTKKDSNWWENRIPPTIKQDINEKLNSGHKLKRQLGIPEYELIEQTNFSHLSEIIQNKKNWKLFEKIFIDKNAILVKLTEIVRYRNLTAHANDLTDIIEKKIQVYYDDIVRLIETYDCNKDV